MKIEHWTHKNVKPDGTFFNEAGAIDITPGLRMSDDDGGCGLENCKCSEGHWLMVGFGYNAEERTVSGITVHFENYGEMQLFLTTRNLQQ